MARIGQNGRRKLQLGFGQHAGIRIREARNRVLCRIESVSADPGEIGGGGLGALALSAALHPQRSEIAHRIERLDGGLGLAVENAINATAEHLVNFLGDTLIERLGRRFDSSCRRRGGRGCGRGGGGRRNGFRRRHGGGGLRRRLGIGGIGLHRSSCWLRRRCRRIGRRGNRLSRDGDVMLRACRLIRRRCGLVMDCRARGRLGIRLDGARGRRSVRRIRHRSRCRGLPARRRSGSSGHTQCSRGRDERRRSEPEFKTDSAHDNS